ncbi:hypothetical protein GCM10009838_69730 [Catenulispora subtropica]|uniref:Uncharacterized protein n=1 Tax=Catenulispora subtropica TaxID=450798 RepID=A0ABN2T152_9ACTN
MQFAKPAVPLPNHHRARLSWFVLSPDIGMDCIEPLQPSPVHPPLELLPHPEPLPLPRDE